MPDYELVQTTMNVWTLQSDNFQFWVWVTIAMLALVQFGGKTLSTSLSRFLAIFYGLLSVTSMLFNYLNLTGMVYFRERVVGLRATEDIPQINPVAEGVLAIAFVWLLFLLGTLGTTYFILKAGKASADVVDPANEATDEAAEG